ncbi:MAG: hypothetical protein NDI61_10360 [Bdellovibrionaceae bacterium]|nr:hypothetical protein [Pseudobdellovibrionaceae bacterium]
MLFRTTLAFALLIALAPERARASQAQAVVPIIAYNPTYKLIVGGAYFNFPSDGGEGSHYGIQFMSTFTNNIKIVPEYKLQWEWLRFQVNGRWTTYYDPYYGEGAQTRVEDLVRLDEESGMLNAGLFVLLSDSFSIGPVYDYRYRQNRGIDGDPSRGLIAPEATGAYGGRMIWDWRDTPFSTHSGGYVSATYLTVPTSATDSGHDFRLASAEWRQFLTWEPITLALRGAGGMGSTTTSYLFRSRLGGTDELRGYLTNRFRGSNFWLGQAELRWEIFSALSLVGFTDVGQVGDPIIHGVKQTYGGGIRFGLPPDWLKKARLDFAFADDQSGVSFVFDETF